MSRSSQAAPEHAVVTDVGRRREHNEDSVVGDHPLYAVADGVGGAVAGERASRIAIDTLRAHAAAIAAAGDDAAAQAAMAAAVSAANDAIVAAAHDDPALAGMATTVSAAVLRGEDQAVIGHVGDSRGYVIRFPRSIRQVTEDHSVVGELQRRGRISAEEAAVHPQRNVITRALGTDQHVSVDTEIITFPPGAWLLLCSDGLTGHVADDEIAEVVGRAHGAGAAAESLVAMANARGGHDNISVVLVQPAGSILDAAAGEEGVPSPAEVSGELDVIPIDRSDAHEEDVDDISPELIEAATHDDHDDLSVTGDVSAPPAPPTRAEQRAMRAAARRRWLLTRSAVIVAICVACFAIGAYAWTQSYFITTHDGGRVAIDRGFPLLGLNKAYRTSDVLEDDLPVSARHKYVNTGTLRSREDAERLLKRMPELAGRCDTPTTSDPTAKQLPDPACDEG